MALESASKKQKQIKSFLEYVLIEEAENEGTTVVRWKELSEILKTEFLEIYGLNSFSLKLKLATSIFIVGSHDVNYFLMVFRTLSDFDVGACFWVVQEELLRQAAILRINNALLKCKNEEFMSNTLVDDLLEVFPSKRAPVYVKNNIVREKFKTLRVDIFMLIVRMAKSKNPKIMFEQYKTEYPLTAFVNWFLKWAQHLLISFKTNWENVQNKL